MNRSNYTILGADTGGFDIASLFKAGGEIVQKGVDYDTAKKAEAKAVKDSADDLKKVLDADALATSSGANTLKDGATEADKLAYDLAATQQDIAARGLSQENQKKRGAAALDALNKANAAWQSALAGKDEKAAKAAGWRVKAAQQTYAKTQNALLVQQAVVPLADRKSTGSWLTKPAIGPVPGVVVLIGGTVTVAGLVALLVKLLRR